jgi:serine/threonine-protein kinase
MQSPKAIETLRTKGLKGIVHSVAADQASGVVVAQDPNAGTQVKRGAQVNLDVSKGPEDVTVPNVVGKTEQQALDQLRTAGFAVTTFDVPAADPQGTVVAQDPAGDTKAKRGARVRINVSTGKTTGSTTPRPPGPPPPPPPPPTTPAAVTVPNLVGQNRKTAAEQVRSLGLKVVIRYVPSEEAVGTVVSQSPAAGTTAKRGGGVLINLSFGPGGEETAKVVPGVIGKDEQTARSTLEGAGFVVEVWRLRVSSPSQNGKVVDEQPGGGQKAPQGSTVTITVGSTSG